MREPVIGIDLGTTNSVVAAVEGGRPRVIPSRSGTLLTPSMVGFTPSGERVFGERARLLREEYPENVAFAAKRYIGRRWSAELAGSARQYVPYPLIAGPAGEVRIKLGTRTLPLTQVSAMVLGELKLDAEAHFGRPVQQAVITVPASFDDAQRQATKEAARIAGLRALRVINEPTAAALAYGQLKALGGRALVFDLGGGTFDVTILEVENGVFEVKATGGDAHLGGEDFDDRIAQWLLAQVEPSFREAVAKDKLSMARLKVSAERAKRELSESEEAYICVEGLGDHTEANRFTQLDTALTRSFFETLSEPLSRRCLNVCEQVMRESRLEKASIETVLLVGGMTRVPLVRALVQDFFGRTPESGLNPDEVVALGAALHAADVGHSAKHAVLIDVASHSLGVGVLGGRVKRILQKNTAVPVTGKQIFLPGQAGQTQVRLPIFQGESDYADENVKLGEVVLTELTGRDRAETPIEVSFTLSSEGTLSVRAVDVSTGLSEALRVEARTELSGAEVDRLRTEQASYAKTQVVSVQEVTTERFVRMLERAEKAARVLAQGADEAGSEDAKSAVAHVRALVDAGRAALKAGNTVQMADIRQKLEAVLRVGAR